MMDYISGWCKSQRRLEGLTAVVTGSNSGIGKETAKDFYLRGARVIMACRNTEKANAAKEDILKENQGNNTGIIIVEELDLCSLKSVRECAFSLLKNESQINILVNNAGVMCCPLGETEDGFETHMGTNHFGPALFTLLLLPMLRKSAPSRVVFLSSTLISPIDLEDLNYKNSAYNSITAYSRSKTANILFSKALAKRLQEHDIFDVTTYSLHPGVVHTELGRHFSNTVWYGASWAWHHILSWFNKTPLCGAQTTIYCAVEENCATQSGLFYCDCAVTTPPLAQCRDDKAVEQLWDITIDALHLKTKKYDPFSTTYPDKKEW